MRNKLPFFLTAALSVMALFVLCAPAEAQWSRGSQKNDKHERERARQDARRSQSVIIRPGTQIYRSDTFYRNDNEGYYRSGRYYETNSYGNIAQIARLNGYEDGLHEGGKDARDGDRFDPFGEDDYEDGDGGYKSRYGNKAEYKQLYRQAFLRGYEEAFNRYLGRSTVRNW